MTTNPNVSSSASSSPRASVWNLLSHRYRDVLMGLNGSKSMLTLRSLPSSVRIWPTNSTRPLGGHREYSFRRC